MTTASKVWCDKHKKWSFTKKYAKVVFRQLADSGLRIYPCKGRYHVGHGLGRSFED